jgi:hypothetical protein
MSSTNNPTASRTSNIFVSLNLGKALSGHPSRCYSGAADAADYRLTNGRPLALGQLATDFVYGSNGHQPPLTFVNDEADSHFQDFSDHKVTQAWSFKPVAQTTMDLKKGGPTEVRILFGGVPDRLYENCWDSTGSPSVRVIATRSAGEDATNGNKYRKPIISIDNFHNQGVVPMYPPDGYNEDGASESGDDGDSEPPPWTSGDPVDSAAYVYDVPDKCWNRMLNGFGSTPTQADAAEYQVKALEDATDLINKHDSIARTKHKSRSS